MVLSQVGAGVLVGEGDWVGAVRLEGPVALGGVSEVCGAMQDEQAMDAAQATVMTSFRTESPDP